MAHGSLHFTLERDASRNRTVLGQTAEEAPLRVLRAFARDDGSALVHLHNLSGGVLGGDRLELRVELLPNANAQITTTGATRIYRCRSGAGAAAQSTDIAIGDGAMLEYLPDPVIPFAGSRYRQHTRITLGRDAGLCWWETFAPGRDGERFAYTSLAAEVEIHAAGRLCARECWQLEPEARPLSSLVRMADYRYHSTFYVCHSGRDAAEWLSDEASLAAAAVDLPGTWGVSTLAAHGLVIRGLCRNAREISSGLDKLWRLAATLVFEREAIPPRKMY